jgi:acetyltransferase
MDMVELISEKSLDCLLNPRSIAIVGVRGGAFDPSARNSMARRFVENLLHHGYKGHIYPINPRYEKVGDLVCYPSISAVPWHVDAALLILPKEKLAASLAECSIKGVRAITVITSGFAESGTQGKIDKLFRLFKQSWTSESFRFGQFIKSPAADRKYRLRYSERRVGSLHP